jgi:cytochrome c oxidase subunit 2
MPIWCKINTQNRSSPLIEQLTLFHDHSLIVLLIITIISLYALATNLYSKNYNQIFLEAQEIEIFWTAFPAFILIFIAIPSMKTLYLIEENLNPIINIKVTGFQWYWIYEYINLFIEKLNSLITSSKKSRLISSSTHLIIPQNLTTRLLITSKDVIHSWTIPSSGVKVDAIPGRINQIYINPNRSRIFIGQCSEICGAGHRFIPIILETPNIKNIIY